MELDELNRMKNEVSEICSKMKLNEPQLLLLLTDPEQEETRAMFEENGFLREYQEQLRKAIIYISYVDMIEQEYFTNTMNLLFNNDELADLAQKLGFLDNEDA